MSRFRVRYSARARQQLREHLLWVRERSEQGYGTLRKRILTAVESLAKDPERHAIALESVSVGFTVRRLLVGKRRGQFRILYRVQGIEVTILAVRRGTQDFLPPEMLQGENYGERE